MPTKTLPSGTVADAYLQLLADRGIDYLFANAGTDFAPLIEAYAKAQAHGVTVPKPITVPHENVAINMAQGYYLMTGRPQAVMVHVNVGTANAMCGLINSWRGNIPVLFTSGRTPYAEEGGLPGERSGEIHWPQEMRDQRAMTREFMKWDYELPNGQVLESAIDRALNIAMTEPRGPVYMTLPRETLAAPIENFRYASPSRHRTPSPPYPDPERDRRSRRSDRQRRISADHHRGRGRERLRRGEARRALRTLRDSRRAAQEPLHVPRERSPDEHRLRSRRASRRSRRRHRARMRRALDPAQEIAARGRQDHPHRRRSDLRQLPVARLRLRSRDLGRHRRDAARARPKPSPHARSAPPLASTPAASASRSRTRR